MIGNEELERLFKLAKEYGVTQFRTNELEFALTLPIQVPEAPYTHPYIPTKEELPIPVEGMPTEDEMLLWSTGSLPDRGEN